jgi:hypothetical protein
VQERHRHQSPGTGIRRRGISATAVNAKMGIARERAPA